MAADTYFEKIRARPYDEASARAADAVEAEKVVRPPSWAFTPGQGEYLSKGLWNVAKGIAGGPVDAIDTLARKVNTGVNAVLDATVKPERKIFRDIHDERILPEVPIGEEMATAAGVARGISTFMTLYGPMAGQLAAAGASGITSSMAAGAFADMMAFENKTGTLADVLRSLGLENEFTQSLSGELSDDEWEASLKAALEGAALGMLGPAFGAVKAGLRRWPEHSEAFLKRLAAPAAASAAADGANADDKADSLSAREDAKGGK